jgi:hypothetical protein
MTREDRVIKTVDAGCKDTVHLVIRIGFNEDTDHERDSETPRR